MNQLTIDGDFYVTKLPHKVEAVRIKSTDSGYYVVFETGAGEMVLGRTGSRDGVLYYAQLNTVVRKLKKLGYSGEVILRVN